MDADLTCRPCELARQRRGSPPRATCLTCQGTGRRFPTLTEWDALRAERDELDGIVSAYHDATGCLPEEAQVLRAERDRYRAELGFIAEHAASAHHARLRARAALDAKEGT